MRCWLSPGGRGARCAGSRLPAASPAARVRGSVLLETALAVPLLLAVAVALCWGISLTATTLALGDAARSAARDLARGEPPEAALGRAQESAPGARLRVEDAGGAVSVVADQEVAAPVPILRGITVTLTQSVVVPKEWG